MFVDKRLMRKIHTFVFTLTIASMNGYVLLTFDAQLSVIKVILLGFILTLIVALHDIVYDAIFDSH